MFESSGVVNILGKNNKSIGTGFFISPEGDILTTTHTLLKNGYNQNEEIHLCSDLHGSFLAKWIGISDLNKDISILNAAVTTEIYFYELSSSIGYNGIVESFGFPNNKKSGIFAKAEVYETVKAISGNMLTQLGKANDVTYGFSGAPIITPAGKVIGMICDIPKPDASGRLANIAFAIPASIIIESFLSLFQKTNIIEKCDDSVLNIWNFVGRENEITQYSQLIKKNNVTIIQGMAGIGKTTLAFHLYDTVISSPKLWLTIRADINNEVETVIHDISEHLARCGQEKPINMFYDLKNNSQTYEVAFYNLQQEIIQCVSNMKLALFIDDAHLINSDAGTIEFFTSLITNCTNSKFVFITRHVLDFVSPDINGEPLKGLIKNDCEKLFEKSGIMVSPSQLDLLYRKTQGNAKFLELCIFSFLERDRKTIDDIIGEISVNFNLNNYIQSNITDRFTALETKILNIIALCRKPIKLEFISRICVDYGFENIYYILDRFVRRNIVDRSKDDSYNMHALLKDHFSRLSSTDMLLIHRQIAESLNNDDQMEVSYHYASCGRLGKAISILINNFDNLISKGYTSLLFRQILSYNSIKQNEDEIQYNLLLGKLHIARGQYDEAIGILQSVTPSMREHYVFDCFILLSQCYEKKGDYSNALNALDEAEKCIDTNDDVSMALISINRGFLFCHQERIPKGILLCEDGLRVIESCSKIARNLLAEGYNNLGWNYTINGDYSKALTSLNKSLELYENDSRGMALAKIRLARINWQKGNLKEALRLISDAEELANLTGDPQLQAFSLRQKNLILWNFGEFDKALQGHKDSLKKYSLIKDYWGIAASLENVAAILYDTDQNDKAIKYIDNAIKICQKITATDFLAYAYLYKSRILSKQGDITEAIDYAKKSINLLRKWKYSSYYYGMALISLGIAYLTDKSLAKAAVTFYLAERKLQGGSALFQKHMAGFYKEMCRGGKSLKVEDSYNYFISIGSKKIVAHLKSIESNISEVII